jgi:hypothetical protein
MAILSFSLKFVVLIRVNLHFRPCMFVQKMFLKDIGEKRRMFAIQVSIYLFSFNNEKSTATITIHFQIHTSIFDRQTSLSYN